MRIVSSIGRRRGGEGMALLITLALLAVVTLLLVAVTNTTRLDHLASNNYTKSVGAGELGMAGLQLVVNQLRMEMGKDQDPDLTYTNNPLYLNVSAANLAPQPVGTNAAMPALVKISTNAPSFTGSLHGGTLQASAVGTATPSLNDRSLSISRWSAPCLGTFPSVNSLPSWVLMTRAGPTDGTGAVFGPEAAAINNSVIGNTNYVIGRFAYAIYDVGGLLDITVAGYPTNSLNVTNAQALKGTLAGADLSALGIDAKALTQWRNAASAGSGSSYLAFITNFAATNGFKNVQTGDTTFLSRQDLIRAAQAGTAGLTTNVLANLTVFSRERNAPSWWPQTPANSSVNYALLATNTAVAGPSTNFFLPYLRYTGTNTITTYRIDGATQLPYQVLPGDPLVYRRFPLDRIRWIGPGGPQNGATDAAIQTCFGLKWDKPTGMWQYVGSTLPFGATEQGVIETLPQVLAEATKREPNFFELLQAGILAGSLGSELNGTLGAANTATTAAQTFHQISVPLHLFRIGASILSQYQSGAYPIVIEYNQPPLTLNKVKYTPLVPWQAVGVANLPYIDFMSPLGGTSLDQPNAVALYIAASLWNPHQAPGPAPARPPVRLRIKGSIGIGDFFGGYVGGYGTVHENTGINSGNIPGYTCNLDTTNTLSASSGGGGNGFIDPHVLLPADCAPAPNAGTSAGLAWATFKTPGSVTYAAYRLPDFKLNPAYTESMATAPTYATTGDNFWSLVNFWANNNTLQPYNMWLEFQNPNGTWVPYNYLTGINDSLTWWSKSPGGYCAGLGKVSLNLPAAPWPLDSTAPDPYGVIYYNKVAWENPDPRSLRYNYTQVQSSPIWPSVLNSSAWSSASDTASQALGRIGAQNYQSHFGANWKPALLARNNNPSGPTYSDPDGVTRLGDSGLFTGSPSASGWAGDPYALSTTRTADRPIILNRPFYSVGELGYVDRDYPWRTLDFFSANSADSGLLDLFTVSQSTDAVLRGRVDLNTRNSAVLAAVLNNTFADIVGGTALSKSSALATNLVQLTAATPLLGKDQLATKFGPSLTASSFGSTDEQSVKARREAMVRALADVGQTRTWNLMIDLVAQVGRYPATATALGQFVVEGEHHFWLHIAIDRFTGQVIDQQLETATP